LTPSPRRPAALLCAGLAATALASTPACATAASSAELRRQARSILAQSRFERPAAPRPLDGLFHWVAPVVRWLSRAVDKVVALVPGRGAVLWPVLAVLVLAAAVLLARRSIRRRARAEVDEARGRRVGATTMDDPGQLERSADEAARAGDLNEAVRLRFRAGLVRLDEQSVIALRPSLTTGEVARVARSPTFAGLAGTFEEVAYGGRSATRADVETARTAWPSVLEEATSR
jgi:hypothetical protein